MRFSYITCGRGKETLLADMRGILIWTLLLSVHAEDATLTISPNWSPLYVGERVYFICDMNEGDVNSWFYKLIKGSVEFFHYNHNNYFPFDIGYKSDSGEYQCVGEHQRTRLLKFSNIITLTVKDRPKAEISTESRDIPVGGHVTLTCSVNPPSDWTYQLWYKGNEFSSFTYDASSFINGQIHVSQEGFYSCRGFRGNPSYYTDLSDPVHVGRIGNMLTISPNWSPLYVGEHIFFKCDMNEGDVNSWNYKLNKEQVKKFPYRPNKTFPFDIGDKSDSGEYQCVGYHQSTYQIKYSNIITLTVKDRPKAEISTESRYIPVGGHVTLTCSVNPPSDWTYQLWYKENKLSTLTHDASSFINRQIHVSQEGFYSCRGFRGNPSYYTYDSDPVHVGRIVTDKAVVTLQPDWPQVFIGESLIVRCEISGENTQWEYEWKTSSVNKPPNLKEFRIDGASSEHYGQYQCKGKTSGDHQSTTEWSDVLWIKVLDKPVPVLTVSPSWLSPGASITLSCDVIHPSAGWKFYWYKEFRTSSDNYFNTVNILPMSINGTATATITINEPSHTTGYICEAGRGDPIIYTHRSKTKFVWSADNHHSVSLKVSPGRTQHFVSDSVLLTCEGNATNSRVMFYTDYGSLYHCSTWGEENGPVCKVTDQQPVKAVFWCESELGFSNAVNITRQKIDGIILVSPVHPVTEGELVTIGCQMRTGHALSTVSFYKDDKLVQSDGGAEMTISTVSKSDEGFYKCQSSGKESPQSWISIKSGSTPEGSSPHILLFVGLVFGLLLIILLLVLLFCYKKSKGVFSTRSNNQRSAAANTITLRNTPSDTHPSVVQDETSDVAYSSINFQKPKKKERKTNPAERTIYSGVKIRTSADSSLIYSQVQFDNKSKAKKRKENSPLKDADQSVYSEIVTGNQSG
ncbi:uncharacterized protein LOC114480037 isoform X3 [Gouania willdenowi]|uniref:uncharacterized protein LOC114480037 isoform X3 n=1 Tax=Gouania willdenowi TaxID=441366 RepID=UPI001056A6B7|nr:Fc receptor-like A isoform X3 [Gouania willdenowi]